jgi:SSS family transporter
VSSNIHLGIFDWLILLGYVALLSAIGFWAARRAKTTTEDYFLAGRSIPSFVTWASFVATCLSAVTFIGTPAEGYSSDFRYLLSNPGDIAATFFIAYIFLPHFQKLKVTSIYEAISIRFGSSVRSLCSGYFLITRLLASTVRVVAIAKVLEVVSGGGFSYETSVFVIVGIVLCYATLGGGRAIAWTDLLQFVLLIGGAIAALIYTVIHVPGGVSGIIDAGRHAIKPDGTIYNKFNFLDLLSRPNLEIFCLMVLWGFFNSSASYGTDQDMVQRLLACRNEKGARLSLVFWGLSSVPIVFLFLSIGASLYAYAQVHPAFVMGMRDPDHVFPRFILTVMPSGLRGLLLAAVASAAMGSADSAMAALSTVFILDFYRPLFNPKASEKQMLKVSKLSFLAFGAFFIVFALLLRRLDNLLWLAFRITAFTYGPLLGIFSVAILTGWKIRGQRLIALAGTSTVGVSSLAMVAWIKTLHGSKYFWRDLHQTYWPLYVVFGTLFVFIGAYLLKEGKQWQSPVVRDP